MTKRGIWIAVALLARAFPVAAQISDGSPALPKEDAPKSDAAAADKAKSPAATPAKNQSVKAPVKPAGAAAEQVVTVTGKASTYQSSIDRRSYNVANDLQKATGGSMADILRNVPSVEVDVQGNVSLRGSQSVTILIDGQPSAIMNGQNRADVLQQLPADQIERVEVMTNPSAAFTPEGAAGIINLITKKSSRNTPKITGAMRANTDTGGHYGVSASETYSVNRLTLSGNAGYRERASRVGGVTITDLTDPVSGVSQSRSTYAGRSHSRSWNAHLSVDYNVDDQTRLSGEASLFDGSFKDLTRGVYMSNAASGASGNGYVSTENDNFGFHGADASVGLVRKLPGDDHEVSVRASWNNFIPSNPTARLFHYQNPTVADLYQGLISRDASTIGHLKAEYKGPLPGSAKLATGYEFDVLNLDSDHRGVLGVSSATAPPAPRLTDVFKGSQTVHALYATYQRAFGPLTLMPGLRLEEALIDLNQVTQGAKARQDYFRAYPTLHLAYKLDDDRQITSSYSQRVQRPNLQNLNPFLVYISPLAYSQGNVKLEPRTTDSYELGYEFRKKSTYYLATLYYRDNRKEFTQISQDIGGGVIRSTQANLGHSRQSGLEQTLNGDLLKTLSYKLNADVRWEQIDAAGLAYAADRAGMTASGRASLNWSPTPQDFLQANRNASARSVSAQGRNGAYVSTNFGYRHKFDDKWAFVSTLIDPFDQARFNNVIDIPGLKQRGTFQYHQRALFLGLTYALGTSKTRASEGFDFNSGGGGR